MCQAAISGMVRRRRTDETPPGIAKRLAWSVDDVEAAHAVQGDGAWTWTSAILRTGDPVKCWGGALLAGTPPMFVQRDPDGTRS